MIGVFDSGVGGLSVLKAIHSLIPATSILYFADQEHVPYGSRSIEEIRLFSDGITEFFHAEGVKIIVVACNTASAAALKLLRVKYPHISFVGMEPAIKPAAESTKTGVVGVLATPTTFQGNLYTSVVERFGGNVKILQSTCPGLVEEIESGKIESRKTRKILCNALIPMVDQGIDTIVLGCTHYPFVIPVIQDIAGSHVRVIDPAPAVARQTLRILEKTAGSQKDDSGQLFFLTSGSDIIFKRRLPKYLGMPGSVNKVHWLENKIHLQPGR